MDKQEGLRYFRVVDEDGKLARKVHKGKTPKEAAESAFLSLLGDKKTGSIKYTIAEKVDDEYTKKVNYKGARKAKSDGEYVVTVSRVAKDGTPTAGKRKPRSKSPMKAKDSSDAKKAKPKAKKKERSKSPKKAKKPKATTKPKPKVSK